MSKRIFSKRMVIMLIILAVVFGLIFGFKAFMGKMMNDFFDNMPQPAAAPQQGTLPDDGAAG